ncbi:hypothetical protein diail_979 [Diaporthe ilicicola]|nr:hypothetical protein diail_979 [Diaporthe ilicicola]
MTDRTPVEPIALVGLSLRLPGGANDTDGLWRLLESGESAWEPVPEDRYNGEAFYHPSADDPNGTSNHPGGHFISGDVRDFDHAFFSFSKSQAAALDPQQRLLLELAYEALESAGMPLEQVAGSKTSVYTAVFPMDYDRHLYKDTMDLPVYYITGVEKAMLSNRISHLLDLRGPSLTLDTACSGGLVALHQACQSLRDGESDAALVGASNLILGPDHFVGLSNQHMLSSTGRCYPFDERGEGYGRGEGVVVLVLKRLEDAIRDRDPVRAVIRGTAVGQDGYTPQSITYPNGAAQVDLVRSVYLRAGLRPEEVAYIEAHGTGTKAGDREEIQGIAEVFAGEKSRPRAVPLYVGSIKGAIGHTESAAGLASLVKATEMLDRELIPPVAGFARPKSGLALDRIEIPTKVVPLPGATGITSRISVNSFGFGGTNAHAILERGPRHPLRSHSDDVESPRLFTFSAKTAASLKAMLKSHRDWVEQHAQASLADLSYTLLQRRSALSHRFSAVAKDSESLIKTLSEGLAAPASKPAPAELGIVGVFTGQGAQWAGMGRELLLETTTASSTFRDSIRLSRDILHRMGATWDLETELLRGAPESRLNEAELAQPATTAIQIALVAQLRAQGLQLGAVLGHSSGEIAAAYAAGHLPHPTAIKAAFHRGFMAAAVKAKGLGPGNMLSVGLGEHDVAKYLENLTRGRAVVACVNSPRSVTISGDSGAIEEVDERIAAADDGTFHRKLLVDTAYHSHHMRAVADDYRARLGTLDGEDGEKDAANRVLFISSVTGQHKTSGFGAEYWVSNLVSPVRFAEAVQTLAKMLEQQQQHHVFFVEIGPHPALSGPVRQSLQPQDMPKFTFDYQAPLQRKTDAVASTLALAGKLFERGVRLQWDQLLALVPGADKAVVRRDLPAYAWDHSTKHWHESRVARAYRLRKEPYHDLLGVPATDASTEPRWRHFLSRATLPWLEDHVVDGLTIFPGAGYICMAIEGVAQLSRQRFPDRALETLVLRDVSFKRGLVVPDSQRLEVQLSLRAQPSSDLGFHFVVTALSDGGEWYEHATGVVEGVLAQKGVAPAVENLTEELPRLPPGSDTTSKEKLYSDMDAVGNTYGPAFAGLHSISMAVDASQASCSFDVLDIQALMPGKHQRPHVIHPSTLDIVFHTALPLVGRRLGPGSIMPVHIDEMLISNTPSLQTPGSAVDISTLLTSSHFRTAVSDMSVLASGHRVLSIQGMEFRSLASHLGGVRDTDAVKGTRQICYELDWLTDIGQLRAEDMPADIALEDIIAQVTAKHHRVSTISLGASVDLSEEVLHSIQTNGKVAAYDFVDATPGRFEDATERLRGLPVQLLTLRPGSNPVARGLQAGARDLVLAAAPKWLNQAAILVKPGGTVVLVLSARDSKGDAWRLALSKSSPRLEEQLAFRDTSQDRLIVVAKPVDTPPRGMTHILTHAAQNTIPAWVSALEAGLRNRDVKVSLGVLSSGIVERLASVGSTGSDSNDTVIVVDDRPDLPILNDAHTFNAASALLRQPARVVWVSPDDLMPFHQIEGVARTAHAENDHLRLTTIHVAADLLEDPSRHGRLVDVITAAASQVAKSDTPHHEREYRIGKSGTVMVPRLHHSDQLDQAIAEDGQSGPKTESRHFRDSQRPMVLSDQGRAVFVDDDQVYATPLGDEAVEVEAHAVVLPKAGSAPPLGEYAGIVTSVGANVKSLAPGDGVVALAPMVGASRVRIAHTHAGRLPPDVPPAVASACLLDLMALSHGLRGIARMLSSGGTVLVHRAGTATGRAAIALARSIGARATATAADSDEARVLEDQIGIGLADVVVARPSLYRRLPRDIFPDGLDVVIQAGEDAVPTEVLPYIRPFGSVIAVVGSAPLAVLPKLPPNVAFHCIDITSLVQARPDLTANLVAEATAALRNLPLSGLEIPVRDVSAVAEAQRLVNTGVHAKIVLQAAPDSVAEVIPTPEADPWANGDATYVVAGGLGDIGRRILSRMALRGAKHLATISRTAASPDAYDVLLAQLESIQPGIRLYTLQGDVSSSSSMQAAATSLSSQGAPPVCGVVMGAVVMIDRPLELMTHDDFTSVTKVKVDGTLALYDAFASPSLRFFLSLSSVSSIIGASAEANYNAGNAVQDALAHRGLPGPGATRFLTVNIGWSEGAALTMMDETRQGALRRAGFNVIGADELTHFFDYILEGAMDPNTNLSHAIIGFDAASLAGATAHNGTIHSALFNHVRDANGAAGDDAAQSTTGAGQGSGAEGAANGGGQVFEQVVSEGDMEAIKNFISHAVVVQLARLISVDMGSIDARQGSILALGLDSLVAVELRNWIMRQFDAPMQSSEILTHQTVHGLAEKITARSKKAVATAA